MWHPSLFLLCFFWLSCAAIKGQPTDLNNKAVASTDLNNTAVASTDLHDTAVASTDLNNTAVAPTDLNDTAVASTYLNNTAVASTDLNNTAVAPVRANASTFTGSTKRAGVGSSPLVVLGSCLAFASLTVVLYFYTSWVKRGDTHTDQSRATAKSRHQFMRSERASLAENRPEPAPLPVARAQRYSMQEEEVLEEPDISITAMEEMYPNLDDCYDSVFPADADADAEQSLSEQDPKTHGLFDQPPDASMAENTSFYMPSDVNIFTQDTVPGYDRYFQSATENKSDSVATV